MKFQRHTEAHSPGGEENNFAKIIFVVIRIACFVSGNKFVKIITPPQLVLARMTCRWCTRK